MGRGGEVESGLQPKTIYFLLMRRIFCISIGFANFFKFKTSYCYDAVGNLVALKDAEGFTTRYKYDSDHNLTRVTNANGHARTWDYNLNGQPITQVDALGNKTSFEYDSAGQLTRQTSNRLTHVGFADGSFAQYGYDGLGRKVYREEMSWKDFDGQEKAAEKSNGKGNGKGKGQDNRSDTAKQKQGTGNGKGKGKGQGNSASNCGKGVSKKGGNGKGHGPLNNPGQGKKLGLYKNGTFALDDNFSQDHVVHKPTYYLYQGMSNVLHKEYGLSGSPYAEYYMGAEAQLVSRKMFGMHGLSNPSHDPNLKTTGGMLYYQFDGSRTVSETTDRHGDIIERYRYDAFGGIFTGITAPYNHMAYTGQAYDGKTGLLDLNARWYHPVAARFMTADTYPGTLDNPLTQNRYAYVLNNPVNMWDPTGHVPEWVRNNEDYAEEYQIGSVTYYDIWFYKTSWQEESATELIDTVQTSKFYELTYEQTITKHWLYDYERWKVEEGIEKQLKGPEEQHFEEIDVLQWTEILTAEEVAQQNEEEIASYGPPPNAKLVSRSSLLNDRPFTYDMIYNKTVESEQDKLLQQQMKQHLGEESVGAHKRNTIFMNPDPFDMSWSHVEGDPEVAEAIYDFFIGDDIDELTDEDISMRDGIIVATLICSGCKVGKAAYKGSKKGIEKLVQFFKGKKGKGTEKGGPGVNRPIDEFDDTDIYNQAGLSREAVEGTPKGGTLSNVEARKWYLSQEAKIKDMIDKTLPLEEQAKQAFNLRNQFRTQARELMADRKLAQKLMDTDPNLTWDDVVKKYSNKGYSGDELWQEIIEASTRSRPSVNKNLGLE
ncbi:MAG: hypothetical protein H0Z33_13645 [Bacillaceae bacterium]|nr:hypothetical protein [Bacillaceae bacterium]